MNADPLGGSLSQNDSQPASSALSRIALYAVYVGAAPFLAESFRGVVWGLKGPDAASFATGALFAATSLPAVVYATRAYRSRIDNASSPGRVAQVSVAVLGALYFAVGFIGVFLLGAADPTTSLLWSFAFLGTGAINTAAALVLRPNYAAAQQAVAADVE